MFTVTVKVNGEIDNFKISELSLLARPLADVLANRYPDAPPSEIYLLSITK